VSVWVDLNAAGFVIIQSAVTAELTRTGAIHRVRQVLLGRCPGPVRVTLATGLLSTVLTNDAALIAIGSLVTHGVRRPHHVLLPALVAANSLGAITPLGNPQNAIIYAHYRVDAREFVATQLPVALALMVPGLVYALLRAESPTPTSGPNPKLPELAAMVMAAACLLMHVPLYWRFPPLLAGYAALRPRAVREVDWVIAVLLTAAILLPHGLRELGWHPRISDPFLGALLMSQVISNVPATVVLAPGTSDWRDLLHGVTVGGFGTPLASIANLIALRMAGGGVRAYVVVQSACLALGTLAHYAVA